MKPAFSVDETTKRRQAKASDPRSSAWVAANAGSGKTFVLARRVIRLLLSGADPAKILCLTFTKAAAAEMSERVFGLLAEWTTLDEEALREEVFVLTGHPKANTSFARQLFAKALETPGGLKIQTIHAFCERLLHQFPVEANVAGHFEVLDDAAQEQFFKQAERVVLLKASDNPQGPTAMALSAALAQSSDSGYQRTLRAFLFKRHALVEWIEKAGGVEEALAELNRHFGLEADETSEALQQQVLASDVFPRSFLELLRDELSHGQTFVDQLHRLRVLCSEVPSSEREEVYLNFFLTKEGKPRSKRSFIASALFKKFPDLEERLAGEQHRLLSLLEKQKALATVKATSVLLRLGFDVQNQYAAQKAASGMMDFDDLIAKTADLLKRPEAAAWVHYKLDQGLDHILVDEAQDTSPQQWEIIKGLADDFFTGDSARSLNRTLFAVGDEKQSIYSFQGASPEWFSSQREAFLRKAHQAEKPFEKVPLSLSFRSTGDVLGAVDLVFTKSDLAQHLTQDYVPHTAARQNQPGFVELWKPFAKPQGVEHSGEWWQPFDHLGEETVEVKLAHAVADAIAEMLDEGVRLEGTGHPITAGDILILSRKRGGQMEAINRALKARGVPVAGSDRLKLLDHIAILDLLSLADFVLLSEDDLALAGLLKSPLVGLSEEDLFVLAHGRQSSLWAALYRRAKKGEKPFVDAYQRLDRWRREVDYVPPYDFFANVLSRDHGRQAFAASLGPESDEVLEAFLNEVLKFEQSDIPTLQGFISWFRGGAVEIKRDLEGAGDHVRVMTVHGSKGLEAPVVFLVDGGVPVHASHQSDILGLGPGGTAPFIWKQSKHHATQSQQESLALEQEGAMAEYYRLLYVAMTRARDRLYLVSTGSEQSEPRPNGWFDVVSQALTADDNCKVILEQEGVPTRWRWRQSMMAAVEPVDGAQGQSNTPSKPEWLFKQAPLAPVPLKSLSPSRLGGDDETLEPAVSDPLAHVIDPRERGRLMHRLLECLGDLKPAVWLETAGLFLKDALPHVDEEIRALMANEIILLMEDEAIGSLLSHESALKEVPLAGTVTADGRAFRVRGVVDHLIISEEQIHLIDFKTNRSVPKDLAAVPLSYLRQMALYHALLQSIYPGRKVVTSLLWTKTGQLMTFGDDMLNEALLKLVHTHS